MAKQTELVKKIADFSLRPGPRFVEQGNNSGELFYNSELKHWFEEALAAGCKLTVVLDGTDGYLSSFIDEAFGRLVYDFGRQTVEKNLVVISNVEPEWLKLLNVKTFPAWQNRRERGDAPRITGAY